MDKFEKLEEKYKDYHPKIKNFLENDLNRKWFNIKNDLKIK